MATHCAGRKTVVFLPLIATSQKFCDLLKARGFRAAEVNGESQNRAAILKAFDAWEDGVLCNSMLLTEGWDCPSVDCVVPLRPTKIRSLFCQMIGRGTRLFPGKTELLLLDFLWNTDRLDLCRPACLIAGSEDVAKQMTETINEAGAAVDLIEAEEKAEGDCVAQREEALAKKLAEMRNRKQKLVDPLQYEMSIAAEDLSGYVPSFGWEMAPVSEPQKEALEKAGLFPDAVECAGKAALLLDRLSKRRAEGYTTPKQIRFLEGKKFKNVGEWEFDYASKMITRIQANGWIVPKGMNPETHTPAPAQRELAI
jgi:type I site-specific restriction endonuclease